jgi:hypothetical protein
MDFKKMSSGTAKLAVLALAAFALVTLAGGAAGAGHERVDAPRDTRAVLVSSPPVDNSVANSTEAVNDDVGCEDSATTDGDPNVPLDTARSDFELVLVRAIMILAALGF